MDFYRFITILDCYSIISDGKSFQRLGVSLFDGIVPLLMICIMYIFSFSILHEVAME